MLGRFRILVSLSAALPIAATDGEPVFNYRGTLDTAHFLGKLFRTLKEVLRLPADRKNEPEIDDDGNDIRSRQERAGDNNEEGRLHFLPTDQTLSRGSNSNMGRVPYGNAPSSDTRQKMTKRQQNIGRRENGELDDEGDDDYSRKESGRKSRSRSNSSRRKTRSRIGGGGGNGKGRTRSRRSLRRNNININSQRSSSWSGGNKARSKQQQQQHQQQKPPPLSRQLSPLPSPSRMGLVSFEGRGGGERRRRSRRRRRHRCSGEEKAESGGEREGSLDPGRHPWCRPCSSSSSRNDLQLWHVSARALFSLAADYLRHNSKTLLIDLSPEGKMVLTRLLPYWNQGNKMFLSRFCRGGGGENKLDSSLIARWTCSFATELLEIANGKSKTLANKRCKTTIFAKMNKNTF